LRDGFGVANGREAAPAPRVRLARAADVLRDLEEPGSLELRADAPPQPAVRVEKRRLHRVLRLLAVPQQSEAIAEDPVRVPRVEIGGSVRFVRPAGRRSDRGEGAHGFLLTFSRFSTFDKGVRAPLR